jgi:hypothetical protein
VPAGCRGEADRLSVGEPFIPTIDAPLKIDAEAPLDGRGASAGRSPRCVEVVAMSDTPIKIWTRCPACRSKYLVILEAVGHHARCKNCQARFRVEEYNSHPTEDDILRWLSEGMEEYELSQRPRIISGSARVAAPATTQN